MRAIIVQLFKWRARTSTHNDRFYVAKNLRKHAVKSVRLYKPCTRWGASLMVWSGCTADRKLPLVVFRHGASVDARTYSYEVLQRTVAPFVDTHDPHRRRLVLQEDGAPAHWAEMTMCAKRALHIPCLVRREFPANSPDLAPHDYSIWSEISRLVSRGGVCTEFHLAVRGDGPDAEHGRRTGTTTAYHLGQITTRVHQASDRHRCRSRHSQSDVGVCNEWRRTGGEVEAVNVIHKLFAFVFKKSKSPVFVLVTPTNNAQNS